MDTFSVKKGSVVGPYGNSASIDADGPVATTPDFIDAAGDIAGGFSDQTGDHAFLDRGGIFTVFDAAPGTSFTVPVGIDAAGDVIGNSGILVEGQYIDHGFVYRNGGTTLIDQPGWTSSTVSVVDAAGDFAGRYVDGMGTHAYLDKGGVIATLDTPDGYFPPSPEALNASGDLAGSLISTDQTQFGIFIDRNGIVNSTFLPAGTDFVQVTGVDNTGTVAGFYELNDTNSFFTANPASPIDSGPKPVAVPAGGTLLADGDGVAGIDSAGNVAGTYSDASGKQHGFLTDAAGMSTTIDGSSTATSTTVTAIDAAGTIFGTYGDTDGEHVFADRQGVITSALAPAGAIRLVPRGEDADGDVIGDDTIPTPDLGDPTFLMRNGTATQFNLPGRSLQPTVRAIDGNGDVVGTTTDADGVHMFIDASGAVTEVDAVPGARATVPDFIRGANVIVGHYTSSTGGKHLFTEVGGRITTVDIPAAPGTSTLPFLEVADTAGDFGGEVEFSTQTSSTTRFFSDIGGSITVFDAPASAGSSPRLVGMDPQGDIGIVGSGTDTGQVVSTLRKADGSYEPVDVPGSVAQTTALRYIDAAGDLIGSYQATPSGTGAPITFGFVRLASSGAYVTVARPAGASSFYETSVDAAGDVFGEAFNPDGTSEVFEQRTGTSQSTVVVLGSGTGRETIVGTDTAGDIAANATATDGSSEAFLVIGGNVARIQGSPSATSTTLQGIDAAGDVFGIYTDSTGQHDFVSFADPAPHISGTHASSTSAQAPTPAFAGVTVQDLRDGATDVLTIVLSGGGGMLADGAGFTGTSTLTETGPNTYTLTGAAPSITAELDALSFIPTAGAPGTQNPTTLTLTDASSVGDSATETVTDAGTVVTDTASGSTLTGNDSAGGGTVGAGTTSGGAGTTGGDAGPTSGGTVSTTPGFVMSNTVSISPLVSYKNGVFTITGTASSPAGVSSVEISAQVDGVQTDLGAATVAADGTFNFLDRIGRHTQSFIAATETGGAASSGAPYSLTGGRPGGMAEEDTYNADGSAVLLSTRFAASGQRFVSVEAPGQTIELQPFDIVSNHHQGSTTFVFSQGDGLDVIGGFKLGGADHDTITLPSADFANFAAVLRNTGDVGASAFVTDPKTGDAIRLAGVTTAELKQHAKDFAFV